LRKLHLLFAVLPLGVFLVVHVGINATALLGEASFTGIIARLWDLPGLLGLEIVGIWVPLVLHTGYGLKLALLPAPETAPGPKPGVLLRRACGFGALLFVIYHTLEFRVPVALGRLDGSDVTQMMYAHLSSTTSAGIPLVAAAYVLGVGATVFHASHGVWSLCTEKRTARSASWGRVAAIVGVLLFALGVQTVVYCATGSRLFFFG
jgi:succinate dehydrogenase / fumarate reductase cytochrome b subunit